MPPIFLAPAAGSSPISLYRLARSLGGHRPVYGFEYDTVEQGSDKHFSVERMGGIIFEELVKLHPEGDVVLGGHCLGGLVALDVTTRLERIGRRVSKLVLLESLPPCGRPNGVQPEANALPPFKKPLSPETKQALGEIFQKATAQLEHLPPEIGQEFREVFWLQTKAGFAYRSAKVASSVLHIRTAAHPEQVFHPWKWFVMGEYSEQIVPGDTFSMLNVPIVESLGKKLIQELHE